MRKLFVALLLCGCGDDVVSYSAPVGISVKAKSGDVVSGMLVDEKNINTESGNPYGAYISAARARLGGRDPSRISLDSLTLDMLPSTTGVTAFEQVYTGLVTIDFVMNSSNNVYAAGHAMSPAGRGPVAFAIDFKFAPLTSEDRVAFIGGNFKVVLRGAAATTFATANANVDMQATFAFTAYK